MKKLMLLLLLTGTIYSQEQVFNVQKYCIDELPFNKANCDVSGNEYSFVFLDTKRSEVTFFLTDQKFKYKVDNVDTMTNPEFALYLLKSDQGEVQMKINKQKNKIEFLYPNRKIYLTVGKSTKL